MTALAYLKAFTAALVAGLGALATALADDSVSGTEWTFIASTTLVALAGVLGMPNFVKAPDGGVARLNSRTGEMQVRQQGRRRRLDE